MKNLIFFLFLILLTSCSTSPTEKNDQENSSAIEDLSAAIQNETVLPSPKDSVLLDTISLDTFNLWVSNWDSLGAVWLDTTTLTAFNMPLIDLSEVLGEDAKGAVSSRFYLGLRNEGSGYSAKLTVVGVNDQNEDMLDASKGEHVYDVSEPCPPICKKVKKK